MDKIIFLDIDGVMNSEKAYKTDNECKYKEFKEEGFKEEGFKIHHYQTFASWSKEYLNELIQITNAKVVISSTWRHSGINYMKEVWKLENMKGDIIGITPSFRSEIDKYSIPRGCEIEAFLDNTLNFSHINWSKEKQLESMIKSNIDNYIILDDDSDMLYNQRNHFVHILPSPRNKEGFNEEYYKEALNKLSKTVIELNY